MHDLTHLELQFGADMHTNIILTHTQSFLQQDWTGTNVKYMLSQLGSIRI